MTIQTRGRLHNLFATTAIAILMTGIIAGCQSLSQRDADPLDDFVTTSNPGCITLGPVELCGETQDSTRSVVWQAFDPTNEARQTVVLGRMLRRNGWDAEDIQLQPGDSDLSKKWALALRTIGNSPNSFPIASLLDQRQQVALRHLIDVNLPPALSINLSSGAVIVDKWDAQRWISRIASDSVLEESCTIGVPATPVPCSKLLTELLAKPDVEGAIRDFVNDTGVKTMTRNFVAYFLVRKKNIEWLKTASRRVYLIHSAEASPQVDILGNLYFPDESTASKHFDVDLDNVLAHEAAHVGAFEFDQLLAFVWQIRQDMSGSSTRSDDEDSTIDDLFTAARSSDEMYIDLLAASEFHISGPRLASYANLVSRLELSNSERVAGLQAVGQLEKSGIQPELLLRERQRALLFDCDHQAIASPSLFTAGGSPDQRTYSDLLNYKSVLAAYESRLGAQRLMIATRSDLGASEDEISKKILSELSASKSGCIVVSAHSADKGKVVTMRVSTFAIE